MKIHKQVKEYLGKKLIEKNYESVRVTLHIPMLGDLFPNLFKKKMREVPHYFFVINGIKRQVDKPLYNRVHEGEMVGFNYNEKNELISITSLSGF